MAPRRPLPPAQDSRGSSRCRTVSFTQVSDVAAIDLKMRTVHVRSVHVSLLPSLLCHDGRPLTHACIPAVSCSTRLRSTAENGIRHVPICGDTAGGFLGRGNLLRYVATEQIGWGAGEAGLRRDLTGVVGNEYSLTGLAS